ncbi:MAG: hypothetical protein ABI690_06760 [Chloroflexota bacterium]
MASRAIFGGKKPLPSPQHGHLTLVPGQNVVPLPMVALRPGGGARMTVEPRQTVPSTISANGF